MLIDNFALEITREIEVGINNFLAKSIKYSPFKIFYNLFKKGNTKLMDDIRHYVAKDILHILENSHDFNIDDCSNNDYYLLPYGEELLKSYEELGKDIFRKYIGVKDSFKLVSNKKFRVNFYHLFLNQVKERLKKKNSKTLDDEDI